MRTNQQNGTNGEKLVAGLLRSFKRQVSVQPYNSPFDLLVDHKWRVEVKTATPTKEPTHNKIKWQFNLHRHGILAESQIDFYVLRLEGIAEHERALHLLVAPTRKKSITLSLRGFIRYGAPLVSAFDRFARDGN